MKTKKTMTKKSDRVARVRTLITRFDLIKKLMNLLK